jgi:hypothetical protein
VFKTEFWGAIELHVAELGLLKVRRVGLENPLFNYFMY